MVYVIMCAIAMMCYLLAATVYARKNQIGYAVLYCTLAIIACISAAR